VLWNRNWNRNRNFSKVGTGTGTKTFSKFGTGTGTEFNFSKVGTGTVKNSYGSTTLHKYDLQICGYGFVWKIFHLNRMLHLEVHVAGLLSLSDACEQVRWQVQVHVQPLGDGSQSEYAGFFLEHQQGRHHQGRRHQGRRHQGRRHQGRRHLGRRHQGRHHQGRHHQGRHHQGRHHGKATFLGLQQDYNENHNLTLKVNFLFFEYLFFFQAARLKNNKKRKTKNGNVKHSQSTST
jgi:hypothetical protein